MGFKRQNLANDLQYNDIRYLKVPDGDRTASYALFTDGTDNYWGIAGATGIQGETGLTGQTGPAGGPVGETGVQGIQGETGVQGVRGYRGETGLIGPTGFQGDTGVAGSTGVANFLDQTGYLPSPPVPITLLWNQEDEALFAGTTGIGNWVQISAACLAGSTGVQGQTGVQGLTGVQGQTGLTGYTGVQGRTGIQGLTGLQYDVRSYSWVISYPVGGYVPGPQLLVAETALKVEAYVSSDINCVFNIQDRTSSPTTTGTNLLASDMTATTSDSSVASFSLSALPANSWLGINITDTSGMPTYLTVNLTTVAS